MEYFFPLVAYSAVEAASLSVNHSKAFASLLEIGRDGRLQNQFRLSLKFLEQLPAQVALFSNVVHRPWNCEFRAWKRGDAS